MYKPNWYIYWLSIKEKNDQNLAKAQTKPLIKNDGSIWPEKILAFIREELSDKLSTFEMPRAIGIIEDSWTPESQMVTGSMKIRRKAIEEKYMDQVELLLASIEWFVSFTTSFPMKSLALNYIAISGM